MDIVFPQQFAQQISWITQKPILKLLHDKIKRKVGLQFKVRNCETKIAEITAAQESRILPPRLTAAMNALKKINVDTEDADSQASLLDLLLKRELFNLKRSKDTANNDILKNSEDMLNVLNGTLRLLGDNRRPELVPNDDMADLPIADIWHNGRVLAFSKCTEMIEHYYTSDFHLRQIDHLKKQELKKQKQTAINLTNTATLNFTKKTFDQAVKKAVQEMMKSKNVNGPAKTPASGRKSGQKKSGRRPKGKAGRKGKKGGNRKKS